MKISIIIPIFNVQPYVERCLQSVISQTYQGPIECLLVDDCGTDQSMGVVEQLIADYCGPIQFKVLHHTHNRGLSAARNTGMDAATGDYLFFLDSDDEITPDGIERLVKPLTEELYDLVVGNIRTEGDDKLDSFLRLKIEDGLVLREKSIEDTYYRKWNMMAQSKLYRIAFIREQGLRFKEGLIHEDELWSLQVACLAKSLRAVNHIAYNYFIREGSLTTADNAKERKLKMLIVIVFDACKFLRERNIFSLKAYQLINTFFWELLRPSLHNRKQFIRDYCELRKSPLPISYRIKAEGLHPRAQLKNLYYMLPPKIAAKILYWRNNR